MNKLEILRFVAELGESESDRTWRRFSMMLTVNAGLVAIVALADPTLVPPVIRLLASFIGIVLSVVWFHVIRMSKYYEYRWHADMEYILNHSPELQEFIRGRPADKCRIDRPFSWSTTTSASLLPISFGLFWVGAGIFYTSQLTVL